MGEFEVWRVNTFYPIIIKLKFTLFSFIWIPRILSRTCFVHKTLQSNNSISKNNMFTNIFVCLQKSKWNSGQQLYISVDTKINDIVKYNVHKRHHREFDTEKKVTWNTFSVQLWHIKPDLIREYITEKKVFLLKILPFLNFRMDDTFSVTELRKYTQMLIRRYQNNKIMVLPMRRYQNTNYVVS